MLTPKQKRNLWELPLVEFLLVIGAVPTPAQAVLIRSWESKCKDSVALKIRREKLCHSNQN